MKSLKSILVAVCMLVTLVGHASGEAYFGLIEGTKKVKVVFDNVIAGDLLLVKNKAGQIFHKEAIEHDGKIHRVFDFSTLAIGNYEIDLKKETEILRKPFAVRTDAIIFKKELKTIIHKPVIEAHDHVIEVDNLYTEDKTAEVVLLFNDVEILDEKLLHKGDHLHMKYNLEEFEKGTYTVIVHNEGETYIKEFKLK